MNERDALYKDILSRESVIIKEFTKNQDSHYVNNCMTSKIKLGKSFKRFFTKHDIITICDELNKVFWYYKCEPEPITEGGIRFGKPPYYKSLRFSGNRNWCWIDGDTNFNSWYNNNDAVVNFMQEDKYCDGDQKIIHFKLVCTYHKIKHDINTIIPPFNKREMIQVSHIFERVGVKFTCPKLRDIYTLDWVKYKYVKFKLALEELFGVDITAKILGFKKFYFFDTLNGSYFIIPEEF